MKSMDVRIVELNNQDIYGVWTKSNDKTLLSDIAEVSSRFHALINKAKGSVLPYYVLCRNHNPKSGNLQLFVGSQLKHQGLDHLTLPMGHYALMEVGPKLGIFYSSNILKAKNYFYNQWIIDSDYEVLNLEYEYHCYKVNQKHPVVKIVFAIKRK